MNFELPTMNCNRLGCSLFARHYWGNHIRFLFLGLLRCFSSPGSLPIFRPDAHHVHNSDEATGSQPYELQSVNYELERGLPHSEISGSKLAGSSPKRIAACRVLHRL